MIHITSTVKTLRDALKPVGTVSDECRLNISPEGLSVKVVDPANVAMIVLKLPKEVFHEGEYTVDETLQVGLDVVTYIDLFEGAADNESAEVSIEPFEEKGAQKHRLILKIADIFEQTSTLINPANIRKEPKIPTFHLRAEVCVSKEFLKRCFDAAAKASDYISIQAFDRPNTRPWFIMEAGDDIRKFKVDMKSGVEIIIPGSPEVALKSLISLDYLCDMVKAIGDGEIITMHLDKDHPLILDFKVLDHGQASFMMAPRVESE